MPAHDVAVPGIPGDVIAVNRQGKLIAGFNPQHGFGGLKWGEFIGTQRGEKMLTLLRNEFCPHGCIWGTISDYGYADIQVEADLYESFDTVNDFALNQDVRRRALEEQLVSNVTLKYMDGITTQVQTILGSSESMKPASLIELNHTVLRRSPRLAAKTCLNRDPGF